MAKLKTLNQIRDEYESLVQTALEQRERRVLPRVNETVPIRLRGKTADAYLFSMDVGLGGIRLLWDEPLRPGEQFDLSIALEPLTTWVHVKAEVLWQKRVEEKYEIGLKFMEIQENQQNKLLRYLKEAPFLLKAETSARTQRGNEEKRRFKRVPRLFLVSIENAKEPGKKISGLIVDISLGGARLITGNQIAEGMKVVLRIELEQQQIVTLRLKAKVIWSNRVEALKRFQHGVEFVQAAEFDEYPPEVKKILETYVNYKNSVKELNLVRTLLELMHEKN